VGRKQYQQDARAGEDSLWPYLGENWELKENDCSLDSVSAGIDPQKMLLKELRTRKPMQTKNWACDWWTFAPYLVVLREWRLPVRLKLKD